MSVFADDNGEYNYLKWNARDKFWQINTDRCQPTKILIDPLSIKRGWGFLAPGQADFVWSDDAHISIKSPGPDYKRATGVSVYVSEKNGAPFDGWIDWRFIQVGSERALKAIWGDVDKAADGDVAVVEITGQVADTKVGKGSTSVPELRVVGYVARPAGQADAAPAPAPAPAPVEDDAIF